MQAMSKFDESPSSGYASEEFSSEEPGSNIAEESNEESYSTVSVQQAVNLHEQFISALNEPEGELSTDYYTTAGSADIAAQAGKDLIFSRSLEESTTKECLYTVSIQFTPSEGVH